MIIQRRNFLVGLGSLLAAPAIVRSQNIMSIKVIDPYYTRYLLNYSIRTDELRLRVDRALHELRIPKYGVVVLSSHTAHKFIPKSIIENIKPEIGKQMFISTLVDWEEGYKISQEIDKWRYHKISQEIDKWRD